MEKLVITQHYITSLFAKNGYDLYCTSSYEDYFFEFEHYGDFRFSVSVKRGCVIEIRSGHWNDDDRKLLFWAKLTTKKRIINCYSPAFENLAWWLQSAVEHVWWCMNGKSSSDQVYFSYEYLPFHVPQDKFYPTGTKDSIRGQIVLHVKTLIFNGAVNSRQRIQEVSVPVFADRRDYKYIVLDEA